MIELPIVIFRFVLAFFLALLFGWNRQKAHKPTGFVTYIFVATGSCALSMAAILISADPLPLLAAIVTGIGFLGAGALLKTSDKIHGFSTASSIWLFAILGLIIGVGEYELSAAIYIAIWIVIMIDMFFEVRGIGSYQKKLTVMMNKNIHTGELAEMIGVSSYKIAHLDLNQKDKKFTITLLVDGTKANMNQIPEKLLGLKFVNSFKFE